MATLNFPSDPSAQTPVNTFSPDSTPESTSNGVAYVYDGTKWVADFSGATTETPNLQAVTTAGNTTTLGATFGGKVTSASTVAGDGGTTLTTKDYVDTAAGGGSEDYVEKIGDNMTGDLTLGTDKITLNATNGSISSAGTVRIGGTLPSAPNISLNAGAGSGTFAGNVAANRLDTQTDVIVRNHTPALTYIGNSNGGKDYGFLQYNDASVVTASIGVDGSASFAGNTKVGTFDVASDTASGFFLVPQGLQYAQRPAASPNEPVYSAYKGTVNTINLNCDGSAQYAGPVSIGGTAAANTISEYEEGIWTPTLANPAFTEKSAQGNYTKIGNVVTATGRLIAECTDYSLTNSSVTLILPFPVDAGNSGGFPLLIIGGGNEFGALSGPYRLYGSTKATVIETPYVNISCGLISTSYYPSGADVTILINITYTTSS